MAFRMNVRIVALALLVSAQAFAQPNPADAEFKRGKELMAQGKYADACAAVSYTHLTLPTILRV